MRKTHLMVLGLVTLLGCPEDATEPDEVFPGFSGTWSGGESSGAQKSGSIKFTVTGTTVAGEVAPISGSLREWTGTVTQNGALSATIGANGNNACAVTLAGQVTNNTDGSGSASGTYVLVASQTCNTNNGTWTATKPKPTTPP